MTTRTDILQIKLTTDGAGKVKASIAGIGKATENTTKKTHGLATAAKAVAAGFALYKTAELVAGLVAVNKEFDSLEASLTTVTGSEKAAQKAFDGIQEFAATTPFQLSEVTNAFIKLKALGLDPSDAALRSYGNTASGMGKSLNQMIEAVADATTGEFERLKEFGIKASVQGDQVRLRFRGITTTIGNNAGEIEGYLRRIGEVEFAGGMARQMDTIGGQFSNLEDSVARFARAIGEGSGFNAALKSATHWLSELFNSTTDVINSMAGVPRSIKKIGEEIAQVEARINKTSSRRGRRGGLASRLKELTEELHQARIASSDLSQLKTAASDITNNIAQLEASINATPEDKRVSTVGSGRSKRTSEYALLNQELNRLREQRKTIYEEMAQLETTADIRIDGIIEAEAQIRFLYTAQETLSDELLRLNGLWQAGDLSVDAYAESVAKAKQEFDGAAASGKSFIELMAEGEQILRDMRTPQEEFADEILRLNGLWQAGAIGVETYSRAILDAQQQMVDDATDKSLQWADAWTSAGNRMAAGIGDAVAGAMLEQNTLAGAMQAVMRGAVHSIISGLVEIGVKKLVLADFETSALTAHTIASTTAAGATAGAWAPAATMVSLASFGANAAPAAAGIASTSALSLALAGQAHDGLDYVPREGTYLLDKGEMVLDKGTSDQVRNGVGGAGTTILKQTYVLNAMDASGMSNVIRKHRGMIESMAVRAINKSNNVRGKRGAN